jgi:hypothetical protein
MRRARYWELAGARFRADGARRSEVWGATGRAGERPGKSGRGLACGAGCAGAKSLAWTRALALPGLAIGLAPRWAAGCSGSRVSSGDWLPLVWCWGKFPVQLPYLRKLAGTKMFPNERVPSVRGKLDFLCVALISAERVHEISSLGVVHYDGI